MMKADEKLITIIQKKLEGILEPEEAQLLDKWLELPENSSEYEDYVALWQGTETLAAKKNDFTPNPENAWATIEDQIMVTQPKTRFKLAYAIAASVGLILLVLGGSSIFSSQKENLQLVLQSNQKDTVQFSDGSQAYLFGPCSLSYPEEFDSKERKVSMEGFAYFDIVHDETSPFEISTNKGTVEVLGTSFTVDTRKDDVFAVQCITGKVRVNAGNKQNQYRAILTRNKKGVYTNQAKEIIVTSFAASEAGVELPIPNMTFENKPLREILKRIEYSYGVSIQLENKSLLETKYSTTIIDSTLEDFLNELKVTFQLEVVQTASSNYILKGGASN